MRFAIIEEGIVTNVVLADVDHGTAQGWIEATDDASIGWTWDGEAFAAPPPPSPEELRAAIPPVTMRQARLALLGAGLLASAEAAIDALPSPAKEAALIEWEYASEVRRDAPLIEAMTVALELTEEQVDGLFHEAAGL